jgi:CRP/FNR family cyclic AMP-dependent transcriptional regulator
MRIAGCSQGFERKKRKVDAGCDSNGQRVKDRPELMSADAALLAEVPLFKLLDEEERTALAGHLDVVKHPAGHVMWEYGDPGNSFYVIRSGRVEVFLKDDTGERIVLERPTLGDHFGELSFLDESCRSASVLVTEELEALRLDHDDLKQFLKMNPEAALDLLASMGHRLRQTTDRLRHTASRNVNEAVQDKRTTVQKIADWIAEFSGSIPFLMIHAVLFTVWIVWNMFPATAFDPYPYGLLTMAVSLEAIFLSVFVLLSQNRQAAKDRVRSDIEYEVNLKAELEVAHLHEKMDRLNSQSLARLNAIERRLSEHLVTNAKDGEKVIERVGRFI